MRFCAAMVRREEGEGRWKGRGGNETNRRRDDRLSSIHSQVETHKAQTDKRDGGI